MRETLLVPPDDFAFWHTIRFIRNGRGDPTARRESNSLTVARWFRSGAATIRFCQLDARVQVQAWGPAADEAIDAAPGWLGFDDRPKRDWGVPKLNRLLHSVAGTRLGRAPSIAHDLLSHVLQQQIQWRDAMRIWREVILANGENAPGPTGLQMPLSFQQMLRLAADRWVGAGLSEKRIVAIREVGRLGYRIDEWYDNNPALFERRLLSIPHIGLWTVRHARALSMGEPDVLVPGDYTIPHTVCWALAGEERGSDERMAELLTPFTGDRWRLVRLLWARNISAPRKGPRMKGLRRRLT